MWKVHTSGSSIWGQANKIAKAIDEDERTTPNKFQASRWKTQSDSNAQGYARVRILQTVSGSDGDTPITLTLPSGSTDIVATDFSDGGSINFFEGETIYQVSGVTGANATLANATATAIVTDWDSATTKLTITNIVGTLSTGVGETIIGAVTGTEYQINSSTTTTLIIPQEPEDSSTMGDGDNIELLRDIDDVVDFTETDPFSEGNY